MGDGLFSVLRHVATAPPAPGQRPPNEHVRLVPALRRDVLRVQPVQRRTVRYRQCHGDVLVGDAIADAKKPMDKLTIARYRVHIPGVDDDVRYAPPTTNTRPTASGVGVVRLRMARPGAGIEVPLAVSPRSPYEEAPRPVSRRVCAFRHKNARGCASG